MLLNRWLLPVLWLTTGCFQAAVCGQTLELDGPPRFRFGDNPAWADPELDDTNWDQANAPESWCVNLDPFIQQVSGWYRFHLRWQPPPSQILETEPLDRNGLPAALLAPRQKALELSSAPPRDLAMAVGVISDAAEVFLNGQFIGGKGHMLPLADGMPDDVLVLDLPSHLLRSRGKNVVAVRVHRVTFDGGIIEGPIAVDSRAALEISLATKRKRDWYLDGVTTCFIVLAFVYSLLLYIAGVREAVYRWLVLATFIMMIGACLDSRLAFEVVGPNVIRRGLSQSSVVLLPLATHLFLAAFYDKLIRSRLLSLQLASVVVLLALAAIPAWFAFAIWSWTIYLIVHMVVWMRWATQAAANRQLDAAPMMFGLLAVVLAVFIEFLYPIRVAGQYPSSLAVLCFFCCGMVAMTQRFQRSRIQAQRATAAILTAHEEERKRLARELHDGVAQSLLAIQLHLQMLQSSQADVEPMSGESLERVVDELRLASDELRRVSHDLRPEALERLELGEAIEAHASQLSERAQIRIDVEAEELVLDNHVKDNLYRIYQEALLNAVKHASANRVRVKLFRSDNAIHLSIEDDGRGLRTMGSKEGRIGVGLTTIRERAELLGGQSTISTSDQGTRVGITLPVQYEA